MYTISSCLSYQITGRDQCGGLVDDTYTPSNIHETQRTARPVGIASAAFSPQCNEGVKWRHCRIPPLLLGTESGGVLVANLDELEWSPLLSGANIYS